ncbi:terminase large subunit [Pantoea phage Kyle]|uniref:Terminase large subunit n=1 Tax=Pantoea phage Kyle TaxID=2589665 RepID=A0A514A8P0_9CAUD|nr:terminase large subunit [Pantoea phage Kyle]QDH49643.1 terminase large subunit [Pantoea phage Kyle]
MYQLNPALRDVWNTKARYKVVYGGRASSKSHDAAGFAVFLAANFRLKFLCVRQFQNKISESVYTLLKDKIENSEFKDEFNLLKNSIEHKVTKSEFLFYGIARNVDEIKSTEGVDVLWLEEAHALTEEQWDIIEPTIRKEGSEIWIIFNPDEEADFVYQNFIVRPKKNSIVRKINWQENPFLSQTMIDVIKDMYDRDPKKAEHVYGGEPKTGGDKSVINRAFVKAALNLHKHPTKGWEATGMRRIGYDVADDGGDVNAMAKGVGNVLQVIETWEGLEDEMLKSAARVYKSAKELNATVTYDSVGIGAAIGSKFSEFNEDNPGGWQIEYDAFNAGGRVHNPDDVYLELPHVKILNKDHFSNVKAQKWVEVAERMRASFEYLNDPNANPDNTDVSELCSIDTEGWTEEEIEQFLFEISAPRKDIDRTGKFKVESKPDMLKRGIKSPNKADAAIMFWMKPMRAAAGFFDF